MSNSLEWTTSNGRHRLRLGERGKCVTKKVHEVGLEQTTVTQKHARLALFRATRSPVRGAWPPARLALTRPASASRLAEHAMGPPGAALLARCAAQSCEKQGGLLSLSMAQRGCWCSRAAVQWREGLIGGGDLVLLQRAQHAPSPAVLRLTCWWATGASFSVLSLALCSMSQYSCCADRRAGRVVPRVEREARGARLSVNQPCGACAPPRLLDRRLALWRRGRRYSNFALPLSLIHI